MKCFNSFSESNKWNEAYLKLNEEDNDWFNARSNSTEKSKHWIQISLLIWLYVNLALDFIFMGGVTWKYCIYPFHSLYIVSHSHPYHCILWIPSVSIIRIRWWKWTGHELRLTSDRHATRALIWAPEGKRKQGRPRETERNLGMMLPGEQRTEQNVMVLFFTWGDGMKQTLCTYTVFFKNHVLGHF
jgi:hypothetical protein